MVRVLLAWVILSLPAALLLGWSASLGSGRQRCASMDDRVFLVTLVVLYVVASACILVAAQ